MKQLQLMVMLMTMTQQRQLTLPLSLSASSHPSRQVSALRLHPGLQRPRLHHQQRLWDLPVHACFCLLTWQRVVGD